MPTQWGAAQSGHQKHSYPARGNFFFSCGALNHTNYTLLDGPRQLSIEATLFLIHSLINGSPHLPKTDIKKHGPKFTLDDEDAG